MLNRKAMRNALAIIALTIFSKAGYAQVSNKPVTGSAASPTVDLLPIGYTPGAAINAVRSYTPVGPFTDYNTVLAATYLEVNQYAEYVDGIGRSLQSVNRQYTPAGKDIVMPVAYDDFGRPANKYLPYESAEANGLFKMDPFNEQKNVLQTKYSDEKVFYSKTVYEASPLNRVTKIMAQGNSWAGSGNGRSMDYLVNGPGDLVREWTITSDVLTYQQKDITTNIPQTTTVYAAATLYKHVSKDEAGNNVVEYVNNEKKVILKKVQVGNVASDNSGYDGFLCTYFIYDDLGQLRFVIPPKAVAAINGIWQLTADVINELCFRYEYDELRRMIAKKTPGSGWTYMVYDAMNRVVFSQDANLAPNRWMTMLYDALDRPVMTGITTWSGSRVSLQQTVTPTSQDAVIEGVVVSKNPIPGGAGFVALTKQYYDDYSTTAVAFTASYNNRLESGNNHYPVAPPADSYKNTYGLPTVSLVKVMQNPADLSAGIWLTTVTFYDHKGRVIQTNSDNHKGGKNITTNLYDHSGHIICTYLDHTNPSGTPASLHLRTRMEYDYAGRLLETKKVLNDNLSAEVLVSKYEYDESGNVVKKQIGLKKNNGAYTTTPIEELVFNYNIRGWLTGINKEYANAKEAVGSQPWFGMELSYDKGFEQNQYTGNLAGTRWRSRGDGERRSYGYVYDKLNRLLGADFAQYDGNNYVDNTIVNFDMTMGDGASASLAYDENGNIKAMKKWGMTVNASQVIDDLQYRYFANSNKLSSVAEQNSGTVAHNLGDFTDNNTGDDDYGYDENGNLITDKNKRLAGVPGLDKASGGAITYNHLNLPSRIAVKTDAGADKGTISYIYDAAGIKLAKVTLEKNVTVRHNDVDYITDVTTTTDYFGGSVYESKEYRIPGLSSLGYRDRLNFTAHEEGRIRYIPVDDNHPVASYEFDYFIKDHLGNVRMVLTGEIKTCIYHAGLEDARRDFEAKLFGDKINTTYDNKPDGFDGDLQNNKKVSRLNGGTPERRVGPGVILKVMAGDKIKARTYAWYKTNSMDNSVDNTLPVIMVNLLAQLVPGISAAGKGTAIKNITNSVVQPGLQNLLNQQTPEDGAPKAYLNWVLFDGEQFKAVEDAYGVVQVPKLADGQSKTLLEAQGGGEIEIPKNGYLYVFVCNESKGDVYFDDIRVEHIRGALMEETHYYPFGLMMEGISSKAMGEMENKLEYNGHELQNKEFTDNSGLELYDYGARTQDPQLGRFWQIDPKCELFRNYNPYNYCFNNPVLFVDPDGMKPVWNGQYGEASGYYDDETYERVSWEEVQDYLGIGNSSYEFSVMVIGADKPGGNNQLIGDYHGNTMYQIMEYAKKEGHIKVVQASNADDAADKIEILNGKINNLFFASHGDAQDSQGGKHQAFFAIGGQNFQLKDIAGSKALERIAKKIAGTPGPLPSAAEVIVFSCGAGGIHNGGIQLLAAMSKKLHATVYGPQGFGMAGKDLFSSRPGSQATPVRDHDPKLFSNALQNHGNWTRVYEYGTSYQVQTVKNVYFDSFGKIHYTK